MVSWGNRIEKGDSYLALLLFLKPAGLAVCCDLYAADKFELEESRYGLGDGPGLPPIKGTSLGLRLSF